MNSMPFSAYCSSAFILSVNTRLGFNVLAHSACPQTFLASLIHLIITKMLLSLDTALDHHKRPLDTL